MYASYAWWGFSNANERQKIGLFAFIRRCIRTGFCSPDLADVLFLYVSSDEKLFNKILTCPNHILRTILPPPSAQNYSLRNRPHNRPDRISRITDCNFTVRMLYRNMYWLLYILDLRFGLFLCTTAVWQFAINECVMLCYPETLVRWGKEINRRLRAYSLSCTSAKNYPNWLMCVEVSVLHHCHFRRHFCVCRYVLRWCRSSSRWWLYNVFALVVLQTHTELSLTIAYNTSVLTSRTLRNVKWDTNLSSCSTTGLYSRELRPQSSCWLKTSQ